MSLLPDSVRKFWSEAIPSRLNKYDAGPVLSVEDLAQLQALATAMPFPALDTQKQQTQPFMGDVLSVFYGQGLEFEDNRLYSPGDDPRFINWRLMARTGELYSKVFRESRRPQVFIVLDRRARMHYGTRRQLKLTQAARTAAFFVYKALSKQFAVAGLVMDEQMHWYRSAQNENQAQDLLHAITIASSPVSFHQQQVSLEDVLQQAQMSLKTGNVVILISDFHDLDKTCERALFGLAQMHSVMAWQILDPVETQLSGHGQLSLLDESTGEVININLQDEDITTKYRDAVARQQKQIGDCLKQTGCEHIIASTATPIETVLASYADANFNG